MSVRLASTHVGLGSARALEISVTDQGVGIPQAELESIFDKFVQSSQTKTGSGGTGLGLSICKEIVQDHGGRIWAQSSATGSSGSIMRFVLPREPLHQPGALTTDALSEVL